MLHDNPFSVLGIGNDIIEIDRIRLGIKKHGVKFLDRLFTAKEQQYCLEHKDPTPRFAGRFSAKEAIVKALGVGFGELVSWRDIEILANEKGRPVASFSEKLNLHFDHPKILLSISHCKLYVTAVAIWIH